MRSPLVTAVLMLVSQCSTALAQDPFGPPPVPPVPQQSAVRGVYDPAHTIRSPATIAPAPPQMPVVDSAITPTPHSTGNATPLEGGEIVARIDGQIVLASDVMWQVNKIIAANRDRIPPDEIEEARKFLLRQQVMGLVDTKLLYADFRRKVPAENIPNIEENLEEPFEENEIPRLMKLMEVEDQRELAVALQKLGTSVTDMQRQFNERTIAGEWLRQLAPKPKEVTYDELVTYYKENEGKGKYDQPAQARWEEIMVRFDRCGGDRNAAWRAIAELGNDVWQRVAANPGLRGAVFIELAKQKSHGINADKGGQYDWTTKGALRSQEIDNALFTLDVGQLSDVIETDQGFHIVRVLERKEAGRIPFTEAQAKIRKELENARKQELIEAEMVRLRKASRVWTIFDGDLTGARVAEMLDRPARR